MDHYCLVLDYKRFCNTVRIYDCIYENGVNKLCQITHMHFDFPTPNGSLQAMQKW